MSGHYLYRYVMQDILVYIVIAVAVVYSIVAIVRGAKRKSSGCADDDCDGCGGCH